MNQILKFTCQKCGNKQYETGQIWTVGSIWTRVFKFYNRRFTYISCQNCGFTELYKVSHKIIGETYNNQARQSF